MELDSKYNSFFIKRLASINHNTLLELLDNLNKDLSDKELELFISGFVASEMINNIPKLIINEVDELKTYLTIDNRLVEEYIIQDNKVGLRYFDSKNDVLSED